MKTVNRNAPVVYAWLGRYPLKVEKADRHRPGVQCTARGVHFRPLLQHILHRLNL